MILKIFNLDTDSSSQGLTYQLHQTVDSPVKSVAQALHTLEISRVIVAQYIVLQWEFQVWQILANPSHSFDYIQCAIVTILNEGNRKKNISLILHYLLYKVHHFPYYIEQRQIVVSEMSKNTDANV